MARFPRDRFDDVPDTIDRVGAHRAAPRPGRGWVAFALALLATAALVLIGLFALSRINPAFNLDLPDFSQPAPGPSFSAPPEAEPITDPAAVPPELELTISVFNASPTEGAHNTAGDLLRDAGWPDPVRAPTSTDDRGTTTVFYWSSDYEGVARGIAEQLGITDVVLSDAYPGAPVTVVLGSDFAASAG